MALKSIEQWFFCDVRPLWHVTNVFHGFIRGKYKIDNCCRVLCIGNVKISFNELDLSRQGFEPLVPECDANALTIVAIHFDIEIVKMEIPRNRINYEILLLLGVCLLSRIFASIYTRSFQPEIRIYQRVRISWITPKLHKSRNRDPFVRYSCRNVDKKNIRMKCNLK